MLPRDSAGCEDDARYTYLERLGVAQDLGLDTSPGSPAERVAAREARWVAAGVPPAWPPSRDGDALDALLVHADALGGLRFVRLVDEVERQQVWGSVCMGIHREPGLEGSQHGSVDGRHGS